MTAYLCAACSHEFEAVNPQFCPACDNDVVAEVCPVHGVAHDLEPEWTSEDERDMEAQFSRPWRE